MKQSVIYQSILIVFIIFILPTAINAQVTNLLWGDGAGSSITTADSVIAIGVNAGRLNTTGSRAVLIGANAGYNNTKESDFIAIGYKAGYSNDNSDRDIYIGAYAGYSLNQSVSTKTKITSPIFTNGSIFIGYKSGYHTTGNENLFIGDFSGFHNTTGNDNTFIGHNTGLLNITGEENVFVGLNAGARNTDGNENTFMGTEAGSENLTGSYNVFIGGGGDSYAHNIDTTGFITNVNAAGGDNTTGHFNTFVGGVAGGDNSTGSYNTCFGYGSGTNTEHAKGNTFIGAAAGWDNNRTNGFNAGNFNTYLGYFAGGKNREGHNNVGIGASADFGSVDVSNTTFLGSYTTVNANGAIVVGFQASGSGQNGVSIGSKSNVTAANAIAIGYQASVTTANEVQIGNSAITSIGGSVNWTATSDGRFKTDVQENVIGLDFINQLRPVTYHFDSKKIMEHKGQAVPASLDSAFLLKNQIRYTGFIAQEVNQAAQNVSFDFSGIDKPQDDNDTDYFGLRYAEFVVPLVKATQELSQKVEDLENENAAQKDLLAKYEAALESALIRLEALESDKAELVNQ